jgi:hypothetical protein
MRPRPLKILRRRKAAKRLAAAKRWQDEERKAAFGRLLEQAGTTPDPVGWRR